MSGGLQLIITLLPLFHPRGGIGFGIPKLCDLRLMLLAKLVLATQFILLVSELGLKLAHLVMVAPKLALRDLDVLLGCIVCLLHTVQLTLDLGGLLRSYSGKTKYLSEDR